MSPETNYLWILVRGHLARAKKEERGVSAVEWVLITGALILLAIGVGAVITARIQSKANSIDLGP